MTDRKDDGLFELLQEAQQLASDIVDFVQDHIAKGAPGATDHQTMVIKAALAIGYATLSKATSTSLHDTIELVMTIYKNTIVEKEND